MLSAKKRLWIEIVLHIAFWVGVFYTLMSLNSSHIHVWAKTRHMVQDRFDDTSISPYVYIILFFLAVLFYGNIFLVFKKAIRYKNGLVRLAMCTAWFMIVFGANYLVAGPLFNNANPIPEPPPLPLIRQMDLRIMHIRPDANNGPRESPKIGIVNFMISDWEHLQVIILIIFLSILGISIAYFFLKEWAKSELIQTQLQANQLSTELKFLKSQINPHFLFNTLNNLFSMAQAKGNDELADGISKLSGMMRYMLYDSNAESVLLSTEIAYLEECITLNKLRYADEEVMVRFNYPEQPGATSIAPMLFIPFVENAFKHGVAIGQTTTIAISIIVSAQMLIFTCENTNHSAIKKMDMEISGIGLENVKRRLQLLYPGKYQLQIEETDEKYRVTLEINLA